MITGTIRETTCLRCGSTTELRHVTGTRGQVMYALFRKLVKNACWHCIKLSRPA